jgi:hypothetical protein
LQKFIVEEPQKHRVIEHINASASTNTRINGYKDALSHNLYDSKNFSVLVSEKPELEVKKLSDFLNANQITGVLTLLVETMESEHLIDFS